MDILKEIWAVNPPATFATICLALYFFGMAVVFISSPIKNAESFSVKPVDNAGKTEIRVYYGGISFALGAFLLYVTYATGTPVHSLVGGLIFATTVFTTRPNSLFSASNPKTSSSERASMFTRTFLLKIMKPSEKSRFPGSGRRAPIILL